MQSQSATDNQEAAWGEEIDRSLVLSAVEVEFRSKLKMVIQFAW